MDFIKILYEMHVSQTQLESPPFTHKINNVKCTDLDIDKLRTLEDNNTVKSFSEECYKIFKERYPGCLKGSVDVNPFVWVTIALNHLLNKIHNRDPDMFVFPNGCCTQGHCSINLLYEIVVEELLTNKRILNTDKSVKNISGDLPLDQSEICEIGGIKMIPPSDSDAMVENNYCCEQCGKLCTLRCSSCKVAHFCNKKCLRLAWSKHKKTCKISQI